MGELKLLYVTVNITVCVDGTTPIYDCHVTHVIEFSISGEA